MRVAASLWSPARVGLLAMVCATHLAAQDNHQSSQVNTYAPCEQPRQKATSIFATLVIRPHVAVRELPGKSCNRGTSSPVAGPTMLHCGSRGTGRSHGGHNTHSAPSRSLCEWKRGGRHSDQRIHLSRAASDQSRDRAIHVSQRSATTSSRRMAFPLPLRGPIGDASYMSSDEDTGDELRSASPDRATVR